MRNLPFSKSLDEHSNLSILLFLGDSVGWESAKEHAHSDMNNGLLLPLTEAPSRYWWPVKNRRVIILDYAGIDQSYGLHIGTYIMGQGASEVLWLRSGHDDIHFIHTEILVSSLEGEAA
jgi:hypothetical protein